MLVLTHLAQMRRLRVGKHPGAGDGVVLTALTTMPNGLGHLRRGVGKNIELLQFLQYAVEHRTSRRAWSWSSTSGPPGRDGGRATVAYADPRCTKGGSMALK